MLLDPNFIQEVEQAIVQKQALISSISNPNLDQTQKTQINQKIADTNAFLNRFYNSFESNQNQNSALRASLSEKIVLNTSVLTGASPKTLKGYLYLAWDYVARDRLPKLLSTRLFLVLGGGYITERLGTDTTLKIISIVILVVFYILSELVVKLASKSGNGVRLY